MSLKRNYSGYMNLDFRTKNGKTSLKLFQPCKVQKGFGIIQLEMKIIKFYQQNQNIF